MLPVKIYPFSITAGAAMRMAVQGQYFKILSSSGALKITSDFGELDGLAAGMGLENTPFTYLTLTNKTGGVNAGTILVGDENFIDALTGNVGITANKAPLSASFVNVNATVTNASAQLIAANAARQYLLVQNNSASGTIYLVFGSAATVATGIKLAPGASFELPNCISTQAIFAIGDIASNANIVTMEG